MQALRELQSNPLWARSIASLAVAGGVLVLRALLARTIRQSGVPADLRRRWLVQLRMAMAVLLFAGLIAVWADAVQAAAVSVIAVAVAVVIALKETLVNLNGTLVRAATRPFAVGDLIEVGPSPSLRQRTGRVVVIPNSLLLEHPVTNWTLGGDYVLEVLSVRPALDEDWESAEKRLLHAAREVCGAYLDKARASVRGVALEEALGSLSAEPRVSVVSDPEGVELVLRYPAPAHTRSRIEQEIARRYLRSQRQP